MGWEALGHGGVCVCLNLVDAAAAGEGDPASAAVLCPVLGLQYHKELGDASKCCCDAAGAGAAVPGGEAESCGCLTQRFRSCSCP